MTEKPEQQDRPATSPAFDAPLRSSASQQLLQEIQERLERLEGNLALRERRLERFENNFRTAAGKLRADRTVLNEEREAFQQQAADQAREAQQRMEENAQALEESQRKVGEYESKLSELTQRVESLVQQRDQARQQCQEAESQRNQANRQREEAEEQRDVANRQRDEANRALDEPASIRAQVRHEPETAELHQQLAESRQQLVERQQQSTESQQRLAESEQQLAESRRQCADHDQEITRLKLALEKSQATIRSMSSTAKPSASPQATVSPPTTTPSVRLLATAQGWRQPTGEPGGQPTNDSSGRPQGRNGTTVGLTPGQRWAAAGVLVVLGFMVVLATALIYTSDEPRYVVTGVVSVPPGDSETLAACQTLAGELKGDHGVRFEQDQPAGLFKLSLPTTDGNQGLKTIDKLGTAIVRRLQERQPSVSSRPSPMAIAERTKLKQRIRQLDRELDRVNASAATQPAGQNDIHRAQVIAASRKALAERRQLATRIDALSARLKAPASSPVAVSINTNQLQSTLAADAMLQADMDALKRHRAEMTTTLDGLLAAAGPLFEKLTQEAAAGDKHLANALETTQASDVTKHLQVMRASVKHWSQAASDLSVIWQAQQSALNGPNANPLAAHARVAPAAKQFLEDTIASLNKFYDAMDALGRGRDELTKRIVLRNRLSRDLQPTLDVREKLAIAVRKLVLSHNIELSALAQRVANLQTTVQTKTSRIETTLRQQRAAEMKTQHQQAASTVRAERERLLREASALDKTILGHATQAHALLTRDESERSAFLSQINLQVERGDLLGQLAAMDETTARQLAAAPPPVVIRYHAAQAIEEVIPPSQRLQQALMIGATPLLVWLIAVGAVFWFLSSRRSSQAIEDCARDLRTRSLATDAPPSSP